MTVDGLIDQAKRNKSALASPDAIEPASVSQLLRIALDCLLQDLDYETDQTTGAAVAARVMAGIIVAADAVTARVRH
jgi:hypothetical protein